MADQKKVPASPTSGDNATANVNATTQSCQEKRVIVIDPGHGGTADEQSSTWNNATSASKVLEKTLTLQYAQSLKQQLASAEVKQIFTSKNYCDVQVILTRETDVNLSAAARLAVATQHKADIFLSIHFNGFDPASVRGTETFYKATSNGYQTNEAEDKALAEAVCAAAVAAMKVFDSKARNRNVKADKDTEHKSLWVLRDPGVGLSGEMCRSAMIEMEFITNPVADKNLVSGPNAAANRDAVMLSVAKALAKAL
ncbi:N-acetylmuramoyl-L-alanine amidase [Chondromyces apiculatus]|uniref:N-acetylmuramoyl-L-alanine amidase n=1 Tax=Chondromyces apiculatus DSM 436 TaxID=1192034 RepID=A0A017TC21_9BACT|nr:N-acetylmuramoyl-L-alanine amidase [Chondromyces apiculatus]EYF06146.1 N-acetylmuramoyl-L-alanine amidase [Chondromyces apiculatus DSM 436]